METKTNKSKQKPISKEPEHKSYNYMESCKVGEILLGSEVLSAQQLCGLVTSILADENIQKYLGFCEKKKLTGSYTG